MMSGYLLYELKVVKSLMMLLQGSFDLVRNYIDCIITCIKCIYKV